MPVIIADEDTGDNGILPLIVVVNLGYGDVKLAVQPEKEWFQAATFFFQGAAAWNMNVEGEYSYVHFIRLDWSILDSDIFPP